MEYNKKQLKLIFPLFFISSLIFSAFVIVYPAYSSSFNNIQISDSLGNATDSDIVWSGSNYGLVWSDSRSEGESEIYFARLNESGEKISRETNISNNSDKISDSADIIWADNMYAVVWSEYDRDDAKNKEGCHLYFTRIDKNGEKYGGIYTVATDDFGSCPSRPAIVWTGLEYGITWHEKRIETDSAKIFFTRLSVTGTKLGDDIIISDIYHSGNSSLVWTGLEYGAVWQSANDIYFARLDTQGVKQGDEIKVSSASDVSYFPDIVWDGSGYGIIWQGYDKEKQRQIFFSKLDKVGNKQIDDMIVTDNKGKDYSIFPSVIWGNSQYGIVWQQGDGDIYFTSIDEDGSRKSKDIRVSISDDISQATNPAVVLGMSQYGLSWTVTRQDNEEIYFDRIYFSEVGEKNQQLLLAFIKDINGDDWFIILLVLLAMILISVIIYRIKGKRVSVK